jgi:hypothetical protein
MLKIKEEKNGMDFVKTPYLQIPETDGVTVMWETDIVSTSQVLVWEAYCPECGVVKYTPQGESRKFIGDDGNMHRVKISGLESGKDFCYQAISITPEVELLSENLVFRTKSKKDGAFSFAVTSETGGSGSPAQIIETLVKAITAERPDFLLFVGDMVDDGRRKQDWDDFLFTPFRKLISHTPFFHCAGNHEERSEYMKDFLATSEKGYYDFTYGCAHFIALDSTRLADYTEDNEGHYITMKLVQSLTKDNPQIEFLTDSLKNSNAKWKFVFLHYPPYTSTTWAGNVLRPLSEIFEKYNVDIVFTSHAIVYERSHPIRNDSIDLSNGVRYIVVGGAGERPDWFHHKKAWHTAKSRAVPHFAHVSVTSEQLEFQAIDLDGKLFDSISIKKV